jgi:tetratricopeptide (TPR) repeat protein
MIILIYIIFYYLDVLGNERIQKMRCLKRFGITAVKRTTWVLMYAFVLLTIFSNFYLTAMATAASKAQELVQEGIDLYEDKKLDQALSAFEGAQVIYPDNIAIPYYLGLIYLEQGDRDEAVIQWKKYIAMAPQNKSSMNIRKNISLLLRKTAKEYARKAVADEASLLETPVDDNAVAVNSFTNLGSENLGPLGKGMAAMIIVDLSHFKDLKVVEREKLQALLDEMELGGSGLLNEKSAPKIGKLLRAKYVTSGSLADLEPENLQISSILLNADQNTTVGTQETQGDKTKFYELEKKIACRIATDLGQDCSSAPKAFGKIHTKSLPAMVAYSQGLDHMDKENYDEASAKFREAVEEDPEFDLAQSALIATPIAAMLLMSESQMISNAAAGAPSSAATTTTAASTATTTTASTASTAGAGGGAAAAGTGTGTTVAASTAAAGGGVGLGTTAAVAGGVAATGAAIAAASNSPESSSDSASPVFEGQWRGTWTNSQPDESGTLLLNLTQSDTSLGGHITVNGSGCITDGNISGSFDGNMIQLEISSSAVSAILTATIDMNAKTMEGTLQITSGDCNGTIYNITTTQTGSADVEW